MRITDVQRFKKYRAKNNGSGDFATNKILFLLLLKPKHVSKVVKTKSRGKIGTWNDW